MDQPWYGDFMSSTGFSQKLGVPKTPSRSGPKEAAFYNQYEKSIPPPPASLGVPGTVNGPGAFLSGQMPLRDSLGTTRYGTPYPQSNILLNKDGTKPIRPTQQKYWQAENVGKQSDGEIQKQEMRPASEFIPGSSPTGGFRIHSRERQDASCEKNEVLKFIAIGSGILAIFAGLGSAARKNYEKQFGAVALISLIVAIGTLIAYSQSGKKTGGNETRDNENMAGYIPDTPDGRKLLMKTGFSPPTYPRQTDQADPIIDPKAPDPEDSVKQRYKFQGANPNQIEGPRANMGYQRSVPTPDGHPTLQSSQLMRSPGNYNMDKGTFEEYMRRMNGEAPPQVAQKQPYYTFNAEWDNRPQIDDSSTYHGIADEPGQMHRKSIYRQPKLQQAGAKRMHLKDPPPGSVMPLQKTHPWMERDESGMEPAFLAAPGEKMIAEINRQNDIPDHPELTQFQDPTETRNFVKERMSVNPAQEIEPLDNDFMKPESVMSDKKKRIMSGAFDAPLEREQLNVPGMPAPAQTDLHKGYPAPPAQPQEEQPPKEEVAGLHSTFDDEQAEAGDGESDNPFLSAFSEKKLPDKKTIDDAMQDVRRA